jgi:hypothetical protein
VPEVVEVQPWNAERLDDVRPPGPRACAGLIGPPGGVV